MNNMHKWFRGPFTEPESEDDAYGRWRQEMDDNTEESMSETPRTGEGRALLRRHKGRGYTSAVGEYTPSELWEALDYIDELERALAKLQQAHEAERSDNEEIGAEFLEKLKRVDPNYSWGQTPTEWMTDQINKYDELKAQAKAERTAAVAEALERAAQACESLLTRHGERKGGSNTGDAARRACAVAIRSLKPRTDLVCVPMDDFAALQNWFGIYEAQEDSPTRRFAHNAALKAVAQVNRPPDLVCVPREPTDRMCVAGAATGCFDYDDDYDDVDDVSAPRMNANYAAATVWKAMLAAAEGKDKP